jgi:RNA 2',3'-cyclic 3'-phosphodiesterase
VTEQLAFPGFDDTREKTDRLLFLTYVDPDAAAQIARRVPDWRTRHGLSGKAVAEDRLHITLNHLGDHAGLPRDMVALALQAAETLAMAPFEVVFDRVVSFGGRPGNLPFVLRGGEGLAQLLAFQNALAVAMRRTGSRIGKWAESNFTPHVTMLYDSQSVAEQRVEPVRWMVREFVLVHSLLRQTRHEVLGRWTLRDE